MCARVRYWVLINALDIPFLTIEENHSICLVMRKAVDFGHESTGVDFEYFCTLSIVQTRLIWERGFNGLYHKLLPILNHAENC